MFLICSRWLVVEDRVMAGVVRTWRIELIEAYPNLFHPHADNPERVAGYPWCDEGWHDLLESLCVRIEAVVQQGEIIWIAQIKEKHSLPRDAGRLSDRTAALRPRDRQLRRRQSWLHRNRGGVTWHLSSRIGESTSCARTHAFSRA